PQIIVSKTETTMLVKDSRFIGYCFPVATKSEAERRITEIGRQHKKATHVCWAYRVYENNQLLYYINDAGEPHGAAGAPILKALSGRNLINTLCIVVRYFGGTKLGIGGLIRAYGATAGKVLDSVSYDDFVVRQSIQIECPLAKYSQLAHLLKRFPKAGKPVFTEDRVTVTIPIETEKITDLQTELGGISGLTIKT
ncbi:MAG: YigZ family protein, partial [Candidatus Marinimicrobia bacterium]|nr:YigZ family protein [Candidatus Neomarinimicrobiota bacterium]